MSTEQEMKSIVVAAGECWHEPVQLDNWAETIECKKCRIAIGTKDLGHEPHPSPTDLNELFRLAEKLGNKRKWYIQSHTCRGDEHIAGWQYSIYEETLTKCLAIGYEDTPADALRTALYQSVKGSNSLDFY